MCLEIWVNGEMMALRNVTKVQRGVKKADRRIKEMVERYPRSLSNLEVEGAMSGQIN